jgi:hypothetical protein
MSYPHWLGLLKWSLGHSDGTSESEFKEMSVEDKQWLEKVMQEMVRDEPKRMSEILKLFSEMIERGVKSSDEEEIEQMLEEVHDIIDQIDMADIFIRFGGIKALLAFLRASELSENTKKLVCVVFGELAQNNPPVQEAYITHGVLDELCMTAATHASPAVSAKALFAVSCTIRGYAMGENRFCTDLAGPMLLLRLLEKNELLLSRRVFFLATALLSSDFASPTRNAEISARLVPVAINNLFVEDVEARDNALHFLCAAAMSREGRAVLSPLASPSSAVLEEALARRKETVAAWITSEESLPDMDAEFIADTKKEEDGQVARLLDWIERAADDVDGEEFAGGDDVAEAAPTTTDSSMLMISG